MRQAGRYQKIQRLGKHISLSAVQIADMALLTSESYGVSYIRNHLYHVKSPASWKLHRL